ncbi:MAG: hypothetical protein FD183_1749 [Chitinophagaceae bacterium]|nr:MAG: hypothetical protein FD183_1749 [Chitinophagaceae bacterium]
MKAHNGMRPQDIAVLLKIIALGDQPWKNKDLAVGLYLSPSEISESISRSEFAGLISRDRRKVFKMALELFIKNGLKYVFPVKPGSLVKGLPTAHSAPIMSKYFSSDEAYVWPDISGNQRGMVIEPVYPGAVAAAKEDAIFYELLALCDVFRVGRVREIKKAEELMKELFKSEQHVSSN